MQELVKFVLVPLWDGFAENDSKCTGIKYPAQFFKVVSFPIYYSKNKIRKILSFLNNDIIPDECYEDVYYDVNIIDLNSIEIFIANKTNYFTPINEIVDWLLESDEIYYQYLKELL